MFSFNSNKVQWNNSLGKGVLGSVYPYGKDPKGTKYVVKWINAMNFDKVLTVVEGVVSGFNLDHPNILPIKGYKIEATKPKGWNIYIKVPRMAGDLRKLMNRNIKNNTFIPEKEFITCFYSLICGLEYIHHKKIPHMNIKPENILISQQGTIKLGDIGGHTMIDSEHTFHTSTEAVGNQAYIAPELLQEYMRLKKKHMFQADIWTLGSVLGELCLQKRISNVETDDQIRKSMSYLEGKYSKIVIDLLLDLLRSNPDERKTATQMRKILEEQFPDIIQISDKQPIEVTEEKNTEEGIVVEDSIWGQRAEDVSPSRENLRQKEEINEVFEEESAGSPGLMAMNLNLLKKEMKKRWQDFLAFDSNEIFSVKLVGKKKVDDSTLRDFMGELKKQSTKIGLSILEKCEFNLAGCGDLTDNGLKELAIDIGTQMKGLTSLSLSIEQSQISDQGIKDLSTYLSTNLINIQTLDLNLASCPKITNQGIKDLAFNVAYNMDQIENLNLSLKGTKINDAGLKELTTNVGKQLQSLKHLGLNLAFCSEITDQGINELTNIGTENPQLESLSFIFTSCHEISDKGLTLLGTHFGNKLKHLKKLNLDFDSCSKLSDVGLKGFAVPIGASCRNLFELHLNFTYCSLLTDAGIKNLAIVLGECLRNLDELAINFTSCNNLSDAGVRVFAASLASNSVNLRNINLNFTGCYKVANETKNVLRTIFPTVDKVTIT